MWPFADRRQSLGPTINGATHGRKHQALSQVWPRKTVISVLTPAAVQGWRARHMQDMREHIFESMAKAQESFASWLFGCRHGSREESCQSRQCPVRPFLGPNDRALGNAARPLRRVGPLFSARQIEVVSEPVQPQPRSNRTFTRLRPWKRVICSRCGECRAQRMGAGCSAPRLPGCRSEKYSGNK